MNNKAYSLKINHVENHIKNKAKSLYFDIPQNLQDTFTWKPGQHLTVCLNIKGKEHRRSYSISSSPYTNDGLRITVKRVKQGLVSHFINDHIKAGEQINVMPPYGSFYVEVNEIKRRTHYFFAAGSGITPLNAMIESILINEPYSFVYLLYGNKSDDSIIFRQKFDQLKQKHSENFDIKHVLSSPSMWSSFKYWQKGNINKQIVENFIRAHPPYAQDTQYYMCGPGKMNPSIKQYLKGMDVPASRIHMENYGGKIEIDESIRGMKSTLKIDTQYRIEETAVQEDQTLLDALKLGKLNPPYSCQSGFCGACKAQLVDGKVHMRANMALEQNEINQGKILTCQSVPLTKQVTINYD